MIKCHFEQIQKSKTESEHPVLVRKMKELLLNNFVSNAKESTTFSMNTGPDFGGSCWICH